MKYVFFLGGPFSQWAKSPFVVDGRTFNTCEQWMMWSKAMMFGDTETASAILETDDPLTQKMLGRAVANFDDAIWMKYAFDIVVAGNREKFTQHAPSRAALEQTKGKLLVEAATYDRRWGVGLAASDPLIQNPKNWRGENLLGQAITLVRLELFGE